MTRSQNSGLNQRTSEQEQQLELGRGNLKGFLNTVVPLERIPKYINARAEVVYPTGADEKSKNNALIIVGKDRMGDEAHGFGGIGTPCSNAIDIVVGLASSYKPGTLGKRLDSDTAVGKNAFTDAARIYISQRTDLDTYFGITEGKGYEIDKKKGVSGIAMKADTLLIVGRRNVKIKAGKSKAENLPMFGERDAHGRKIHSSTDNVIEFIGSEGLELEPLVKGDKLVLCLDKIYSHIRENTLSIQYIISEIARVRIGLAMHNHLDPFTVFTGPSPLMISEAYNGLLDDLEEFGNTIVEQLKLIRNETVSLQVPNKAEYLLSKNVFTT
jgi:hypothetical protein